MFGGLRIFYLSFAGLLIGDFSNGQFSSGIIKDTSLFDSYPRDLASDCPSFCPLVWNPVCGSDGETYDNACRLQAASCRNRKRLFVLYEGVCRKKFPNKASCLLWKHCPRKPERRKVCGSDGKTYLNECFLKRESCRSNQTIFRIPCSKIFEGFKEKISSENPGELLSAFLTVLPSDENKRNPKKDNGKDDCLEFMVCDKIYYPVCGSDGKTYDNECVLQGESKCNRNGTLVKAFTGDCEREDRDLSEACKTFDVLQCPNVYDPVCGSDDQTYANECVMLAASCKKRNLIIKRYDGNCDLQKARKKKQMNENFNSDCPKFCNLIYRPVCGNDGITYGNLCQFSSKSCKNDNLTVVAQGPCPSTAVEFEPVIAEEGSEECPKFCTLEYNPVCGTDGNTYSNQCHLVYEACEEGKPLEVSHPGMCPNQFEAVVVEEEEENGEEEECPIFCTFDFNEVCGSDGMTYRNKCQLKFTSCQNPDEQLIKVNDGPCTPSIEAVEVEEEEEEDDGQCPKLCTYQYNPVCGTDGKTYDNKCRLDSVNCDNTSNTPISVAHNGACFQKCPNFCSVKYEPVCGSDGVTYTNECQLLATNCRLRSSYVTIVNEGECKLNTRRVQDHLAKRSWSGRNSDIRNCEGIICGSDGKTYGSICEIDEINKVKNTQIFKVYDGKCTCPQVCMPDKDPVCGSDGLIYSNECGIKTKICSNDKANGLYILPQRECGLILKVNDEVKTQNCPKDTPKFCPLNYDPVCGTDGNSYANVCQMKKQSCIFKDLKVKHHGLCYCSKRSKNCLEGNPRRNVTYCGLGRSYDNYCDLEFDLCEDSMISQGHHNQVEFFLRDTEKSSSCIVPKKEDVHFCDLLKCESWPLSPICASDGRTFANLCYFRLDICFKREEERVREKEDFFKEYPYLNDTGKLDITIVREGPCDTDKDYVVLTKDDYFNEDESFQDVRLKIFLQDVFIRHTTQNPGYHREFHKLLHIEQQIQPPVINILFTQKTCLDGGCNSELIQNCSLNVFSEIGIIDSSCSNSTEEFTETENLLSAPPKAINDLSSCSPDGKFYYPIKKKGKELVASDPLLISRWDKKCCPTCNQSSENNNQLVCGSNGVTFQSFCQLKRYVCLKNFRRRDIFFLHNGPCLYERDFIANVSKIIYPRKKPNVHEDTKDLFTREFRKNYPRWEIKSLRIDGIDSFLVFLIEKFCFDGRRSQGGICRSALYGRRKMVCHVETKEMRIIHEDCEVLAMTFHKNNEVFEAAKFAVEHISQYFNDNHTWMLTSSGKLRIEPAQGLGERKLISIYLTMTQSKNCLRSNKSAEEQRCVALDSSPINFCDVRVEKSRDSLELKRKICAGYSIEQFF